MSSAPTGTVTFLFTDVEGSTEMWERDAPAMQKALARHDDILRGAIESNGGFIFKTVGDAFCAAFPTAPAATEAALAAQRALLREEWGETGSLRVRVALHTGAAEERGGDYFGPPLNRVSRLLSTGHGGQTLLSLPTQELVRDHLPAGAGLRDLGERRLKDLFRPERVFQLSAPGLPEGFPPLKTLDVYRNNLPLQPTPLVGREREVAAICERLRSPEVRLLTLVGPGGTGKTRVGLQAAAELLEEFEGGVFFVALATLNDPTLVASTVAQALGVTETGDRPLEERLEEYLSDREALLLLDNFEQVLGATPLLEGLLDSAPRLKALATSRAALRLYGEHEFPVPPLGLPDTRRLPEIEALAQYEAVRLFIERARAVKPDFAVTNENAPAVAEICARLDGLPLAIELAAARTRLLPPRAMLKRLGSRLKLLTGGARNLPERQRTLRGAIEWSHGLLAPEEQALFARLAVFAGGRTLEAVEAVCDPEGGLDVLDGVESLLEKSLLRREEGPDGEPRFVMLETVHEYARERLEDGGEAEEVKRAHAQFFRASAEEAEPELRGPRQASRFERLEAEHDNFRAALSWSLEAEPELQLRLAGALSYFWAVRGHYGEGRGWLEEGLAKDTAVPATVRAKALAGAGDLADLQGDFERAKAHYEGALALFRELGDGRGVADALIGLGWSALYGGDLEQAEALYGEALSLSRSLGDVGLLGYVLNGFAWVAWEREGPERAGAMFEEALALSRKSGDVRRVSIVLINLGFVTLLLGDHERAKTLTEESLGLSRGLGDRSGVVYCLANLGGIALDRGDHERAMALLGESLKLNRELGDKAIVAEVLHNLAGVAGARQRSSRSARLYGAAEALREAIGAPLPSPDLPRYERHLAAARSGTDEGTWGAAWKVGRAMTLYEAVAYALEEADAS